MVRGLLLRMLMGPWTALCCAAALVAVALTPLVPRWRDATLHVARVWSRAMLAVAGATIRHDGLEHARAEPPRIYVSNHQSHVDVWALLALVPASTRFVAKAELFRLPLLGWVLRAAGFVRIDRRDRAAAIASLETAAAAIRGGRSMLLYAEGTRSRDGRLLPFKKGAFHLALAARVPLVPIAVSGAHEVMPPHGWRVRAGEVEVRFLPPIDVAQFEGDHERLLDEVHGRIAAALDDAASTASARPRRPRPRAAGGAAIRGPVRRPPVPGAAAADD